MISLSFVPAGSCENQKYFGVQKAIRQIRRYGEGGNNHQHILNRKIQAPYLAQKDPKLQNAKTCGVHWRRP